MYPHLCCGQFLWPLTSVTTPYLFSATPTKHMLLQRKKKLNTLRELNTLRIFTNDLEWSKQFLFATSVDLGQKFLAEWEGNDKLSPDSKTKDAGKRTCKQGVTGERFRKKIKVQDFDEQTAKSDQCDSYNASDDISGSDGSGSDGSDFESAESPKLTVQSSSNQETQVPGQSELKISSSAPMQEPVSDNPPQEKESVPGDLLEQDKRENDSKLKDHLTNKSGGFDPMSSFDEVVPESSCSTSSPVIPFPSQFSFTSTPHASKSSSNNYSAMDVIEEQTSLIQKCSPFSNDSDDTVDIDVIIEAIINASLIPKHGADGQRNRVPRGKVKVDDDEQVSVVDDPRSDSGFVLESNDESPLLPSKTFSLCTTSTAEDTHQKITKSSSSDLLGMFGEDEDFDDISLVSVGHKSEFDEDEDVIFISVDRQMLWVY